MNTNDLDGAERLSQRRLDSSASSWPKPLVTPPRRPTAMATQDSPITALTRAATYPTSHAQKISVRPCAGWRRKPTRPLSNDQRSSIVSIDRSNQGAAQVPRSTSRPGGRLLRRSPVWLPCGFRASDGARRFHGRLPGGWRLHRPQPERWCRNRLLWRLVHLHHRSQSSPRPGDANSSRSRCCSRWAVAGAGGRPGHQCLCGREPRSALAGRGSHGRVRGVCWGLLGTRPAVTCPPGREVCSGRWSR